MSEPSEKVTERARRVMGLAPGRAMTEDELREFLARPWNAKVGCIADDGSPYVVPSWYEWDGQDFWLVARARSVWARYLQREPRVFLCIDQEAAPHPRVLVQGRAEIVEEPNVGGRWVPIAECMAARYLGAVDGPGYLVPTLNRPRWLIRVHPDKLTTWTGGSWHPRYLEA
jgi:PPOX class probable F420-dependent enzyme